MTALFDPWRKGLTQTHREGEKASPWLGRWGQLVYYHSRFLAKRDGQRPSRLCVADKLSIVLMPFWLYYPMARLSGEIQEYMSRSRGDGKYATMHLDTEDARAWYRQVQDYLRDWIAEQQNGGPDTMTPAPEATP